MHKYEIKIISTTFVDANDADDARRIVRAASTPTPTEAEAHIQEEIITGIEIIEARRIHDEEMIDELGN